MDLFETYKDPQINKNFRKASSLSLVGLILAFLELLVFISDFFVLKSLKFNLLTAFFLPLVPLSVYMNSTRYSKIPTYTNTDDTQKTRKKTIFYKYTNIKQTKWNNDYSNLLTIILLSFDLVFLLVGSFILDMIMSIFDTDTNYYALLVIPCAETFGYCFISHIFVYVADIFLFKNLKIIKRLWKENPPEFMIREREREKKKEEQELKDKELAEYIKKKLVYKKLIEKCGTRFFIKYYKQILRLPLRDIEITENYSSEERDERLISAKTIIDKGLAEFAFTQIIDTYADVLSEEEIEQAKTLLAETKE